MSKSITALRAKTDVAVRVAIVFVLSAMFIIPVHVASESQAPAGTGVTL